MVYDKIYYTSIYYISSSYIFTNFNNLIPLYFILFSKNLNQREAWNP